METSIVMKNYMNHTEEYSRMREQVISLKERIVPALEKIATVQAFKDFATEKCKEFLNECNHTLILLDYSENHSWEEIQERMNVVNDHVGVIADYIEENQTEIRKALRG